MDNCIRLNQSNYSHFDMLMKKSVSNILTTSSDYCFLTKICALESTKGNYCVIPFVYIQCKNLLLLYYVPADTGRNSSTLPNR